jgi:PPOX class probable F420-dependent enzyme
MSEAEISAFLEQERTLVVATIGRDGFPHLMPLWYVVRDGVPWAWTYGKSQKVRNLERDPRCTLQIEAGEAYHELRGVMFKAKATIHRDIDTVAGIGADLAVRYSGAALSPEVDAAMRSQAAKRVGLSFTIVDTATWDHSKLGGTY